MKITVMIDNLPAEGLCSEWGLAIHIEYNGHSILLDTGATGAFARNAYALGIDLGKIEFAVLSHAHFDHADGMDAFFSANNTALFYISSNAAEDCYDGMGTKYIGIKPGTLDTYRDRIRFVSGDTTILPGITIVPHKTAGLETLGKRANMYRLVGGSWKTEDFCHEQSLVFDTDKGLVIFNSCSHGGADNIINEVAATFPEKHIYAIIGGFHLFASKPEEVLSLAKNIKATGIDLAVTGHCTGDESYRLLKTELGERLQMLRTGLVIEI